MSFCGSFADNSVSVGMVADGDILWDMERLSKPPATREWPKVFDSEATPIMIEGEPYQGRPTWCFAYYGIPESATPVNKAPAIVLVHGGLGTAYPEWVRMWVRRGYAAICVDTCGALPIRTAEDKWMSNPEGDPRGWGRVECAEEPVRDQWVYHAVAAVIRSHSFLRSLPNVDSGKIGVTGVSWGGFLTCILSAVDTRFAYAVPVYGCGFNYERPQWIEKNDPALLKKWAELWDASLYLPEAKCPMLWVDGTNDFAFSLDRVRRSAALASKVPHVFSTHLRMVHAHGEPGEGPLEILAFADHFARSGKDVVRVRKVRREGNRITAEFDSNGRKIVRAELLWTEDGAEVKWDKRLWERRVIPDFDPESSSVSALLPDNAFAWIVNFVTDDGLVFSTPYCGGQYAPEECVALAGQ
jgi:dienelactone hydrolase